jgi:hypothetical protein
MSGNPFTIIAELAILGLLISFAIYWIMFPIWVLRYLRKTEEHLRVMRQAWEASKK